MGSYRQLQPHDESKVGARLVAHGPDKLQLRVAPVLAHVLIAEVDALEEEDARQALPEEILDAPRKHAVERALCRLARAHALDAPAQVLHEAHAVREQRDEAAASELRALDAAALGDAPQLVERRAHAAEEVP